MIAFTLIGLFLGGIGWRSAHLAAKAFPPGWPTIQVAQYRLSMLGASARQFYELTGKWPQSIEELAIRPDPNMANFLRGGTNDPWNHVIVFEAYDAKRKFGRVISYGADGKPGGNSEGRDIIVEFGPGELRIK